MRSRTVLPLAVSALLTACGVRSPEEQVLARFFDAARLHDTTMVAAVSDVDFNPRVDGIVERFSIASDDAGVTPDTRTIVLEARVHRPDGRQEARRFVVGLQSRDGRWRIIELRDLELRVPGA